MMVQRGRGVEGYQPEKKQPDYVMRFQESPREQAVLTDHGWQLTEEEPVHSLTMRVCVEETKDRLD